eukprot:TRINITY_DN50446_c0_g1_i1.p1 TRINITY_DN50446_c0_g1~~TRINITY_DN50446_c0_g1_i1.p1  ORF type:complete len:1253 (+),score=621.41 TRINITY_DN50446_c0_g1_i1:62-3820(+)
MSTAASRAYAEELEEALKGKPFLGGDVPTAKDAAAFEKLVGGTGDSMHLARWAKHMASFTAAQRRAFPTSAGAVSKAPAAGKPARPEELDHMLALQDKAQAAWESSKLFEVDPPTDPAEFAKKEKFMATFPYPYMNGKLHLGHAFSMLKAEFAVAYNRLEGKHSLFPFGFHCTGMPIQAAANKLTREYEVYGSPSPKFPCGRPSASEEEIPAGEESADSVPLSFNWAPPTSTGHQDVVKYVLQQADGAAETKEWVDLTEVGPETTVNAQKKTRVVTGVIQGFSRSKKYVFRAITHLSDGTVVEASAASELLEFKAKAAPSDKKDKKKKGPAKIAQKSGDALHQWDIMRGMGMTEEEIPAFVDPMKWLDYFPPKGQDDLKRLGLHIDFRRSFITTSVNPFYDKFISWQFNKLKEGNYLAFGKRPTIYSPVDKQACMDHDRSEGEGVGHTEFTAVKVKIVEPIPEVFSELVKANPEKPIYILCGTLRPETMVGQTNCWILPEGQYGVFNRGSEFVICSDRAARNMSFQDIFPKWGEVEKVMSVSGADLLGAAVKAPLCQYPKVYLLPLPTIKMDKMTGIVTSVPADSPDDYLMWKELRENAGKRKHFGVKDEWILPFDLKPLSEVEIDGEMRSMAAMYLMENKYTKERVAEAHDECYSKGFYQGVMTAGDYKGMRVELAKPKARKDLCDRGDAFTYHEPEKLIRSRSGDECTVALIDQWYLKYGEEEWRNRVLQHVENTLDAYTDACKKAFTDVLAWLKEWACSRSFGLGTQIPWDKQFVIESLSDSTIYMAYYTMAKYFHGHDNLKGDKPSPYGIKAEDLTDDVFSYILLGAAYPESCKVEKSVMEQMRRDFEFWYPMDLRVSGKDLIQNHLTMSLYNHAAIWKDDASMWPRSFYTNGWVLVDNEKMSKSKGNFMTLTDAVNAFSADGLRIGCAFAGDTMEDANFEVKTTEKALRRLHNLVEFAQKLVKGETTTRQGEMDCFADKWFNNDISRLLEEARVHYSRMRFKEALRCAWYDFHTSRDLYLDVMAASGKTPLDSLLRRWLETIAVIMSVITPHASEEIWSLLGKTGSIIDARFPTATTDSQIVAQGKFVFDTFKSIMIEKFTKALKKKPKVANVYVAATYPAWKMRVIAVLKDKMGADGKFPKDAMVIFGKKDQLEAFPEGKDLISKGAQVGKFAAMIRQAAEKEGTSAFDVQLPFDELPLLEEHAEYLKSKIDVEKLTFYKADQEGVPDAAVAENADPGKPAFAFNA